eukprot:TRINITY_DN13541_c0_g1_i2.p1 TRINITY_DN13541_c0_g1~~TRINITY_DN13541_c0_g1_i2.p1  ORF type:complete len:1198 (-),score=215.76 TRINITY_DN13541_c0_g1_i2:40-3564(-)
MRVARTMFLSAILSANPTSREGSAAVSNAPSPPVDQNDAGQKDKRQAVEHELRSDQLAKRPRDNSSSTEVDVGALYRRIDYLERTVQHLQNKINMLEGRSPIMSPELMLHSPSPSPLLPPHIPSVHVKTEKHISSFSRRPSTGPDLFANDADRPHFSAHMQQTPSPSLALVQHASPHDHPTLSSHNSSLILSPPHLRTLCPVFRFSQKENWISNEVPYDANAKSCDQCYCFVCDMKASQCVKWASADHSEPVHCNAENNRFFRTLRTYHRNPLLLRVFTEKVMSISGQMDPTTFIHSSCELADIPSIEEHIRNIFQTYAAGGQHASSTCSCSCHHSQGETSTTTREWCKRCDQNHTGANAKERIANTSTFTHIYEIVTAILHNATHSLNHAIKTNTYAFHDMSHIMCTMDALSASLAEHSYKPRTQPPFDHKMSGPVLPSPVTSPSHDIPSPSSSTSSTSSSLPSPSPPPSPAHEQAHLQYILILQRLVSLWIQFLLMKYLSAEAREEAALRVYSLCVKSTIPEYKAHLQVVVDVARWGWAAHPVRHVLRSASFFPPPSAGMLDTEHMLSAVFHAAMSWGDEKANDAMTVAEVLVQKCPDHSYAREMLPRLFVKSNKIAQAITMYCKPSHTAPSPTLPEQVAEFALALEEAGQLGNHLDDVFRLALKCSWRSRALQSFDTLCAVLRLFCRRGLSPAHKAIINNPGPPSAELQSLRELAVRVSKDERALMSFVDNGVLNGRTVAETILVLPPVLDFTLNGRHATIGTQEEIVNMWPVLCIEILLNVGIALIEFRREEHIGHVGEVQETYELVRNLDAFGNSFSVLSVVLVSPHNHIYSLAEYVVKRMNILTAMHTHAIADIVDRWTKSPHFEMLLGSIAGLYLKEGHKEKAVAAAEKLARAFNNPTSHESYASSSSVSVHSQLVDYCDPAKDIGRPDLAKLFAEKSYEVNPTWKGFEYIRSATPPDTWPQRQKDLLAMLASSKVDRTNKIEILGCAGLFNEFKDCLTSMSPEEIFAVCKVLKFYESDRASTITLVKLLAGDWLMRVSNVPNFGRSQVDNLWLLIAHHMPREVFAVIDKLTTDVEEAFTKKTVQDNDRRQLIHILQLLRKVYGLCAKSNEWNTRLQNITNGALKRKHALVRAIKSESELYQNPPAPSTPPSTAIAHVFPSIPLSLE